MGWTNSETAYLEISTDDGETWTKWEGGSVDSGSDNKIYLRGKGLTTLTSTTCTIFCLEVSGENLVDCSGNIMTLLDYEKPNEVTMGKYAFKNLFYTCDLLKTAPALPAMKLAEGCYLEMFMDCTSLTAAPELPAEDLTDCSGCYKNMFQGCDALKTAPTLPAMKLAEECYRGDV